jgi:hypothetical protein
MLEEQQLLDKLSVSASGQLGVYESCMNSSTVNQSVSSNNVSNESNSKLTSDGESEHSPDGSLSPVDSLDGKLITLIQFD